MSAPTAGTWGISPTVRRALARNILELRSAVEDDFRKQLVALGVRPTGAVDPPRPLDANEQRTRDVAMAVVARDVQAGIGHSEAVESFVGESAYTFLNRMVGLRCLDERRLLVVDGQAETAVKLDPTLNASSLYWRVRNALPPTTNPREVWRDTISQAGDAISERIRVLFDPQVEHASLLPSLATLQQVVAWLNSDVVPDATWAEDELLGWVYQYYQSAEKDAAYARLAKGKKLEGPAELAAATCLYTERYMVDYLLQNTLGALWMEMYPESRLPEQWPYYVPPPADSPRSKREPKPLRSITLIDPGCGSGHFLVRAFELLAQMYREEGREPEAEIPHLILERNLYGIDIDARAVQIAALALYLKACSIAGADFRPGQLNLVAADAVLPGDEPAAEYLARFKGDPDALSLVKSIWQGLQNVREFGSLLHPERAVDATVQRVRKTHPLLLEGGRDEEWKRDLLHGLYEEFERQAHSENLGQKLFGEEAAKGVSLVDALGRKYDVVVMNPPYAGSRNLNDRLKKFVEREYREGKRDMYAAFVQRCRDFARRGGYVGMVTQQSWLFLRSFAALRKLVLEQTAITTLAHLGPRAFDEIGGEVVSTALFTLRNAPPAKEHRLAAFRLIGPKSPAEKDALLHHAVKGGTAGVLSTPKQADFIAIPETPVVYWLRPRFFELLRAPRTLSTIADVKQGLATSDNERFTRFFWEVDRLGRVNDGKPADGCWFWYAKGGRYQKWAGLRWLVINWERNGAEIRAFPRSVIRNPDYYFRAGVTYSPMTGGSLGGRLLLDSVFDVKGASAFAKDGCITLIALSGLLSNRLASYLMRVATQRGEMHVGYVSNLPLPSGDLGVLEGPAGACIALKQDLIDRDPTEGGFQLLGSERRPAKSLFNRIADVIDLSSLVEAALLVSEGECESAVFACYAVVGADLEAVTDETGVPAAWQPALAGYSAELRLPSEIALRVQATTSPRTPLTGELRHIDLRRLMDRLRGLYQAGRGNTASWTEWDAEDIDENDDEELATLGAHLPIPAETFLEELSQKLEIHPISVYWLLKEMREQEALVSPPELKRHVEDYASVTLLRLLGYRWPEQDAYEAEHGPILGPDLVDQDGIIPLVPCGDELTAAQRVRQRLERQFGDKGADESEQEFRQWVGRSIEDWLTRDFFKRHIQQFKQRPIAWHFVSPEGTFQAFVIYHRLSRETLYKLRTTYAGGLIGRLRGEQDRARQASDARKVSELQLQIEDVEEFRDRVEWIERGDELKYRVRCRWKGEEQHGRPGPYSPDIDDGVKVNIRPFQEAGLLAVKEVIKKW